VKLSEWRDLLYKVSIGEALNTRNEAIMCAPRYKYVQLGYTIRVARRQYVALVSSQFLPNEPSLNVPPTAA